MDLTIACIANTIIIYDKRLQQKKGSSFELPLSTILIIKLVPHAYLVPKFVTHKLHGNWQSCAPIFPSVATIAHSKL